VQRLLADFLANARGGRAVERLTGRPLIIIVVMATGTHSGIPASW
jgi:hypothetical protein